MGTVLHLPQHAFAARALALELERLFLAVAACLPPPVDGAAALGPMQVRWPCLGLLLAEVPTARRARRYELTLLASGHVVEAEVWSLEDGPDRVVTVSLLRAEGSAHALTQHARRLARAVESTLALRGVDPLPLPLAAGL